jgi:hypothetical protein
VSCTRLRPDLVFTMLDISTRRQLGAALPKDNLAFVDA